MGYTLPIKKKRETMYIQELKKKEFDKCDIVLLELRNKAMKFSYRVQENRYGVEWQSLDFDTLSEAEEAYVESIKEQSELEIDEETLEGNKESAENYTEAVKTFEQAHAKANAKPSPLAPVAKAFNKGLKSFKTKFKEVFYEEVQSVKPILTDEEKHKELEELKAQMRAVNKGEA